MDENPIMEDLRHSCFGLVNQLRRLRKDLEDIEPVNLLTILLYARKRSTYRRTSQQLARQLDKLSKNRPEGDQARFERNYERLKPDLGGWKLVPDTSLATMAAALRGEETPQA